MEDARRWVQGAFKRVANLIPTKSRLKAPDLSSSYLVQPWVLISTAAGVAGLRRKRVSAHALCGGGLTITLAAPEVQAALPCASWGAWASAAWLPMRFCGRGTGDLPDRGDSIGA